MSVARLHVVAAVLQDAERYFVHRRQPGKHMAGYWEFPGGKLESGETPWQALVRELHEELGVSAHEGRPLVRLSHSYPEHTVELDVWLVTAWQGSLTAREQQLVSWSTLEELARMPLLPADVPVLKVLAEAR